MQSWGEYLAFGAVDPVFKDDEVEKEKKFSSKMYPSGNELFSVYRNCTVMTCASCLLFIRNQR
jgi:hypothetical protein